MMAEAKGDFYKGGMTKRGITTVPVEIEPARARSLWIAAQRLNREASFGSGSAAVAAAIRHLGYVQIDTINVVERCHHHILFNRIPSYRRADLARAQSVDRTVFEYWTHALSYVPVEDMRYFIGTMKAHRKDPTGWGGQVGPRDLKRILDRVRDKGALAISDIKDDKLVEKEHLWASRKPSKRALQAGFYSGQLVISRRDGMLKTYELTERHFGWDKLPKPATPREISRYQLERALRTQGVVSMDSICFNATYAKPAFDKAAIAALIEGEARAGRLLPVRIAGAEKVPYWIRPAQLDEPAPELRLTHVLSPFDPLVIQRKRMAQFFGYTHLFEAYVPKAKRRLGYFTLPVLSGDEIVAALDLKAERETKTLLIQAWHWVGKGNAAEHKPAIDQALEHFAAFQFEQGT